MKYSLCRFLVIASFCPKDVFDERLRVAVVEREPARLDLDHDPMTGQKDMVGGWQREIVQERRVGSDRFRELEALAITAAENVAGDHQLVAAHLGLDGD